MNCLFHLPVGIHQHFFKIDFFLCILESFNFQGFTKPKKKPIFHKNIFLIFGLLAKRYIISSDCQ